jgi:hypothetical protein
MLNRADRFGMIKLVRKSSDEGKADERSSSTFGAALAFLALFLVRNRFIAALARLVNLGPECELDELSEDGRGDNIFGRDVSRTWMMDLNMRATTHGRNLRCWAAADRDG